jgi:hypothetical protein
MATASDRSSQENKEIITLIWFDSNTDNAADTQDTMKTLRELNDYVLVYSDIHDCISYIQSVTNEKIFLVTSGVWATYLLPYVIDLTQLEVVFVLCAKCEQYFYLVEQYSKISGVFVDRKELNSSIRKNLHLLNKQVQTFSFYDQKQKVTMNLSERTAEFLW